MPNTSGDLPMAGWILYDATCGVCAWWVPFWAPTLRGIGFGVAPLQAPWVLARTSLPTAELLRDIQLLRTDGTLVTGANVYRTVMRSLWWAYPVYLLPATPRLRWAFDRGYRAFADHRLAISEACRLPGASHPPMG